MLFAPAYTLPFINMPVPVYISSTYVNSFSTITRARSGTTMASCQIPLPNAIYPGIDSLSYAVSSIYINSFTLSFYLLSLSGLIGQLPSNLSNCSSFFALPPQCYRHRITMRMHHLQHIDPKVAGFCIYPILPYRLLTARGLVLLKTNFSKKPKNPV